MENDASSSLRRPVVGLVTLLLAIALLPFWSGGSDPLGRVIAANVLLLGSILMWVQPRTRAIGWRSPLTLSALAFIGWATLSLIWSVNRYQTELWIIGVVGACAAFGLAYRLADTTSGRWWVQRAYLAVTAVSSVYGLWVYYTDDYNRLTSAFFWANPMAGFLLPAVIYGLDYIGGKGKQRWIWVLTGLDLVAFWLTQSRGATLVLILMLTILLWYRRAHRRYWVRLILTIIVTYLVSTLCIRLWHYGHSDQATSTVSGRFIAASSSDNSSTSSRVDFLASGVQIWFDHPFAGTGAGTYPSEHPRYQVKVISASNDAHNWYLQTFSELGLMGIVLLGLVVIALITGLRRGLAIEPEQTVWVIAITALVLHMGLDIDAQYPVVLALVGVGLGLIWRPAATEYHYLRASLAMPILMVAALTVASAANTSHLTAEQASAAQSDNRISDAADLYLTAHQKLVYDPTLVEAEGIDYYSLATGGTDAAGNEALALDRAQAAEKLAPTLAPSYQLEGRVYLLQKDYSKAAAALRRALELDPYNEPSYAQDLAVALHDGGDTQGALKVTRAMLEQYPQAVLDNRNNSVDTQQAVYQLWLYQEFLDSAAGNAAAAARDHAAASEMVKLESPASR